MKESFIIILFILQSQVLSRTPVWVLKRKVGEITIYKTMGKQKVRATYQKFNKPSILKNLRNKETVIKNFEKDKKKGLTYYGITNWKATQYQWNKNKSLTVYGTYTNRDKEKVSFVEYHQFNDNSREVALIIREDQGKIHDTFLPTFLSEVHK